MKGNTSTKCFKFRTYSIESDQHQYILKDKNRTNPTYHGSIQSVMEEMYLREQKSSLRASQDLTEAVKRLSEMHKSFIKELKPLKDLKI